MRRPPRSIAIEERRIPLDDYLRLREETGWWPVARASARDSLRRSAFSLVTLHDGAVIGCARVVGDPMYFYVQDVIVAREWRGRGIGTTMMKHIMTFLHSAADEGTWVGLMCARHQRGFYERFGFSARPSSAPGMQMRF